MAISDPDLILVKHERWEAEPDQLNFEIKEVWRDALASREDRDRIANILEITPEELDSVKDKPPVAFDAAAGFEPGTIIVVATWTATAIILPALADIAKDELKKLWREVLLPRLKEKNHKALDEEK